ncbi:hypothetical protein D1007_56889 [Hordeum vulgare]|nr:hypothetical protein D1007_56889 [Hordeum vulgare]
MHCIMTIGEARAHYMYIVWEEQFWEAHADASDNQHLLQKHQRVEEQLAANGAIASEVNLVDQAAQLVSYRSAHQIRLDHSRYRQRQAKLEATYKEYGEEVN